jgi:hypothetical protein
MILPKYVGIKCCAYRLLTTTQQVCNIYPSIRNSSYVGSLFYHTNAFCVFLSIPVSICDDPSPDRPHTRRNETRYWQYKIKNPVYTFTFNVFPCNTGCCVETNHILLRYLDKLYFSKNFIILFSHIRLVKKFASLLFWQRYCIQFKLFLIFTT